MRAIALIVATTCTLVIAAACALFTATETSKAEEKSDADRLAGAQRALVAWFECIECVDFELEKLLRYRDLIEGALISTLDKGPSPARLAEIEQGLITTNCRDYPELKITKEQCVDSFRANAIAGYRSRAATALGQLRTHDADEALKRAVDSKELRADVRAAAERALRH